MSLTRRRFIEYCAMGSAVSGLPWDSPLRPLNMLFPPDATPPRGLDPPKLSSSKLVSSPKPFLFSDDPQVTARKEQLRAAWTAHPRPTRQDGMFPYLLIRAAPGDQGARPAVWTKPGYFGLGRLSFRITQYGHIPEQCLRRSRRRLHSRCAGLEPRSGAGHRRRSAPL